GARRDLVADPDQRLLVDRDQRRAALADRERIRRAADRVDHLAQRADGGERLPRRGDRGLHDQGDHAAIRRAGHAGRDHDRATKTDGTTGHVVRFLLHVGLKLVLPAIVVVAPLSLAALWPSTVTDEPLSVAAPVASMLIAPCALRFTSPPASSVIAPSASTVTLVEPMVTTSLVSS